MLSDMIKLSLLNGEQESNHHVNRVIIMMIKRRFDGKFYSMNGLNDHVTFVMPRISPELQPFAVGNDRN